MFLKFKIILFTLIFSLGLESILFFGSWWLFSIGILLLLAIFQGKKLGGRWIFAVLPSVFSIFSAGLLYLVTLPGERQAFIALSSLMYYLSLLGIYRLKKAPTDQTARGMVVAGSFTALFFAFSASYGFYLNYLVPVYVLMLGYFAISLLISYGTLIFFKKGEGNIWFFSFVLSFLVAQIVWTLNFWPFGYLTTGVIALILYYVLWEIIRGHISLVLSKKRLVGHLVGVSVLIGIVLLTSKWTPTF
ncbi:MAG: hypothetical protein ACOYS2_02745 [Patescibacteria group bacterium]